MTTWFLYMIRCANGALYTGITTDVPRRFREHQTDPKRGARYLRGKGPLALAYQVSLGNRGLAAQVEYRVKRLSKTRKEGLVAGDWHISRLIPD